MKIHQTLLLNPLQILRIALAICVMKHLDCHQNLLHPHMFQLLNTPWPNLKCCNPNKKSLANITNNLEASVEDWKALLKAKVDVSIKKKVSKIGNLRVGWECGVIMDEEFKVKVKELLDLWLIVAIYKIVLVFTNDFNREVLVMPM
jgi:hypothetical protein